jgi:phage terminase large subunit
MARRPVQRIVIPYKPRKQQLELHKSDKRFSLNICHRRFGKTVFEINKLLKAALTCQLKNPRYAYIAPYFRQAKTIAWDYLKFFCLPIPGVKFNESELRADLPNGARIQLFGADNPDSLRGIYLDGCVLDEYAQIRPSLLPEIIRPALSDRKGWLDVTGTPKGRNHFWDLLNAVEHDEKWSVNVFKASETGIVDSEELEEARKIMSADQFEQEFECSFTAAIQGSYFHKEMKDARADDRILKNIPIENGIPVNTFWDLGMNDTTVIWFHQQVGLEHRFVDFYEANGEALSHYAKLLKEKDYLYGDHYLPHDVVVKELQSGRSRLEVLQEMGVKPIEVVPRVTSKGEAIEAARASLPKCWFSESKCDVGIRALENYRKEWDDKRQVFRDRPLHDWASNPADAFMQFAQGFQSKSTQIKLEMPQVGWLGA